MKVIVVGNLLGEGGDVELGARTSEQISVFAIGLLASFTCFIFIAIFTCFIIIAILSINTHTTRLHCAPQKSYLEESRGRSSEPFTGYSASSLVSGDRCIIIFNLCIN